MLEPTGTRWESLHLELDPHRLDQSDHNAALAHILLIVLRNLASERLPLGFATHRGMGAVRVKSVGFQFEDKTAAWHEVHNQTVTDWSWTTLPAKLRGTLQEAWNNWTKVKP